MPQRLGTVPHTEPINAKGISSKMTYQAAITQRCSGIKIKVLHAQPPWPVLRMSTCAQVSPGSSVPQPANDPASIAVLDRPSIAPTGCTPLLGARVLYASYMRKALANAYVSPTLKHLARRVPMHEHFYILLALLLALRMRSLPDSEPIRDSETTIQKLRLGNYSARFRN